MTSNHFPLKLNQISITSGITIFAIMGGLTSAYGAMVPYFRDKFELNLAQSGIIFFTHGVTALFGVIIGILTVSKIKAAYVGGLGAPLMALGAFLIGTATSWNLTLLGVAVVGIGFGACDATISQFLSRGGSARAVRLVNILNAAFALGAVIGPILIAGAVPDLFSELMFAWAIAFLVMGYLFISNTKGYLKRDHSTAKPDGHKFGFTMMLLGLGFYVGVEVGTSGWIPTYMIDKGYSAQVGATVLALFFVALALGRILILPIAKMFTPTQLVITSSILIIFSVLFIALTPYTLIGFSLMGLVCGPIFPTAMVWAVRINPGDPRTAGFLMAAAIVGATISPTLIGVIMEKIGTGYFPWLILAPAIVSLFVYLLAAKQKIAEHIEIH